MATATKGYDWSSGDTVTAARLDLTGTPTIALENDDVTTAIIQDNAVTTAKIADANVTKAKIENLADYKVLGNVSGGAAAPAEVALLDEDDMASNSATSLATQQSIKAYVDDTVAANKIDESTLSTSYTDSTEYENTSGRPLLVLASAESSNDLRVLGYRDASSPVSTVVSRCLTVSDGSNPGQGNVTFIVPSGYFWKVVMDNGGYTGTISNQRIETIQL